MVFGSSFQDASDCRLVNELPFQLDSEPYQEYRCRQGRNRVKSSSSNHSLTRTEHPLKLSVFTQKIDCREVKFMQTKGFGSKVTMSLQTFWNFGHCLVSAEQGNHINLLEFFECLGTLECDK